MGFFGEERAVAAVAAIDRHIGIVIELCAIASNTDLHIRGKRFARPAAQLVPQFAQSIIGNSVVAEAPSSHGVDHASQVLVLLLTDALASKVILDSGVILRVF